MKRVLTLILLLLMITIAGCKQVEDTKSEVDFIQSYKNVSGITEDEISAMEALKLEKGSFSYGTLHNTDSSFLSDGAYADFEKEFYKLLSDLFDVEFVRKPYDDGRQLITDLDERLTDFTCDLSPSTLARDSYATDSILDRTQRLYTLSDSNEIMTEEDVNGLTLGFFENGDSVDSIQKRYPRLSFHAVPVDSVSLVEQALVLGEIDAFVTEMDLNPLFHENDRIRSKPFFPLAYTSTSLTTANPELAPVISVLNKYLAAGGTNRLNQIFKENEYEHEKRQLLKSLNGEERAYLNELHISLT